MSAPRVLFIGGTGTISSEASELAVRQGLDVTLLNRGLSSLHTVPAGARALQADVRDADSVRDALGRLEFDIVVDFVAFGTAHVQQDIDLFSGRIGQYVFISSASAYQKPPARLPITESTPLRNPFWQYSRDKIACEDLLVAAYRDTGFPTTIVRPSHTYDAASIPLAGGWTAIDRLRRGVPIVLHGDGTSLWVLTHSRDFAKGFVGLLGNQQAIGESVHITSDEVLTWTQIAEAMATAAGVEAKIVHVTSDALAAADPDQSGGHLGDRSHSVIFDNSKLKSLVPGYVATTPFALGAREIIDWHDEHPLHQVVDPRLNELYDRLVSAAG
ncbi:NAD-dependent epimerase/dehydratase family protein [Lacisediminihabitans profunda]|uniref:NAD-dependent epimerase/dehydratase family protein n=1 Tax=Lacisediminihabitans profunda TaxID=2594790 RepID=A0A5C8UNB5_9MICO|nr:NAD-dependent epimerase/dehydratase family protein [Lacisediminihabitans profunda]TXN29358.1 NAD-dependent epimerase/dehydratase family protein [Lacisediminihabitans profunda]